MPVTVKIKQEKKEKLNRCLASLLLRESVKISFQNALGLIIDYAFENEEAWHLLRVAWIARLLARNGIIVLCSLEEVMRCLYILLFLP